MIYEIKELEWKDIGFTGNLQATSGFLVYRIIHDKHIYLYTYSLGARVSAVRVRYVKSAMRRAETDYRKKIISCLKEPSEAALMRYVTSKDIPG